MDVRHHAFKFAKQINHIICHVFWMYGVKPDSIHAFYCINFSEQLGKRGFFGIWICIIGFISIYILAN